MMFTCVVPGCADPRHRFALAPRPGKKKTAKAATASAKALRDSKKRAVRVDIHCHYLNTEVAAKVAHLNPGQHEPMVKYANALTRETNAKQGQDRAPKLTSIEVRLKDM